ncbi:MAG TPA: phage holin family protein [Synechococcales cyanobacterium M55_K2018_004]|nr:phage holin family protein [Synechococcales cyanobacterium M55_K2018_004]
MTYLLVSFVISVIITAITLMIVSKLSFTGVELTDVGSAVIGAIVFGLLNGILYLIPGWLRLTINIISLGFIGLIVNMLIFALTAWLVEGFRLRWGAWSALIGSILLAIINGLLLWLFRTLIPFGVG